MVGPFQISLRKGFQMLVLARKRTESISITGGITITVIEIGLTSVRIAIDAPDEVRIWRTELLTEGISVATQRRENGGRNAKPE